MHSLLPMFAVLLLAPSLGLSAPPKLEWVTTAVQAPRVSFHTFDSAAVGSKVSYHIYTPAVCEREPQRRFPVIYWLHGSGGGIAGIPKVAAHFDAAIEAGRTPPCYVVFVNGLPEGMYVDWKDGSAPLESILVKELVPHIDATFRTIATPAGRLIEGFSMGGYGAARLGFKHPDIFHAVSLLGSGPLQPELTQTPRAGRQRAAEILQRVYGGDQEYFRTVSPRRLAEQNASVLAAGSLIRQVCGDQDETFANNRSFHEHLERLKIPHAWIILEGVDHDPLRTLSALGDANWTFYQNAFGQIGTEIRNSKPDIELTLQVQEQTRRAIVVNAPADDSKRPAVIVLHGGMGNAAAMRANSGFDAVARANGFMVIYAEGTGFGNDRHAWNTGFLMRRLVQKADDIAYFDILIDRLVQDYGADSTRICMTGGSNGGMMTFVYATARPERLAAIAPVVASMFSFEQTPSVPLPILIINGARDAEVPLKGGMSENLLVRRAQEAPYKPLSEVVQFWVKANRSQATATVSTTGSVTTTRYPAGPDGAVTEFVLDAEGGHGWPGSQSRRGGNSPIAAFSGAERVWQFFRDQQRTTR